MNSITETLDVLAHFCIRIGSIFAGVMFGVAIGKYLTGSTEAFQEAVLWGITHLAFQQGADHNAARWRDQDRSKPARPQPKQCPMCGERL